MTPRTGISTTDYWFQAFPAFVLCPDPPNTDPQMHIWCDTDPPSLLSPPVEPSNKTTCAGCSECIKIDFNRAISKALEKGLVPQIDDPRSDNGYTEIYPGIGKRLGTRIGPKFVDTEPRGALYFSESNLPAYVHDWAIESFNRIEQYQCLVRADTATGKIIARFHGFQIYVVRNDDKLTPRFIADVYWANQSAAKWLNVVIDITDTSLCDDNTRATINADTPAGETGVIYLSKLTFKDIGGEDIQLGIPKLPPSLGPVFP